MKSLIEKVAFITVFSAFVSCISADLPLSKSNYNLIELTDYDNHRATISCFDTQIDDILTYRIYPGSCIHQTSSSNAVPQNTYRQGTFSVIVWQPPEKF